MPYINRLKTMCGGKEAFYIPKNAEPLVFSNEFSCPDSMVSDEQKARGLQLVYYPEVYTIKRDDQTKQIALKDISEHTQPLPTKLAGFKNLGFPKITLYGYMLCIDKDLLPNLAEEEKAFVKSAIAHFQKIKERNPMLSAAHELKHEENRHFFNELHKKYGLRLTDRDFLINRYLDEISATNRERLIEQSPQSLDEMKKTTRQTQIEWLSSPEKQAYYQGENSDFAAHLDQYREQTKGKKADTSHKILNELAEHYFTYQVNGKNVCLSSAVNLNFSMPESLLRSASSFSLTFSRGSR